MPVTLALYGRHFSLKDAGLKADLSAADTLAGGAGFDILSLTTAGVVFGPQLAGVSGLEQLNLTSGFNNINPRAIRES